MFRYHYAVLALIAAVPLYSAVRAYIPLSGSNRVLVINTAGGDIVGTIPVGTRPQGVSFDPHHATAYITNSGSNSVSVIATATHTVFLTVPVGAAPLGVAVTPDGSTVFVANSQDGTVSFFTALSATATAPPPVFSLRVGPSPRGVAATPDGKYIFVTVAGNNSVAVIDVKTKAVVKNIGVGKTPIGIAIVTVPPYAQVAVVANSTDNSASLIDVSSQKVINTVAAAAGPHYVAALNFPAAVAWLLSTVSPSLTPLSFPPGSLGLALTPVAVASTAGLAAAPDGATVWTAGADVGIFDSLTYRNLDTIATGFNGAGALGQFIGPIFRQADIPEYSRPQADLAIAAVETGPSPRFVIQNSGPGRAPDVVFTLPLPPAVTFLAAKSSQGACVTPPLFAQGATLTCYLGMMHPGETAVIDIAVAGPPTNVLATVDTDYATDPVIANDSISISVAGGGQPDPPAVQAPPVLSMKSARAGTLVMNGGQRPAAGLSLTLTLPSGVTPSPSYSALGCSFSNTAQGRLLTCPARSEPDAGCAVTKAGLICLQSLPVNSLAAHEQAWVVFPVELNSASLLNTVVSVTVKTSTPGALLAGHIFPSQAFSLGKLALVTNAAKIWGDALPETAETNCSTDLGGMPGISSSILCLGAGAPDREDPGSTWADGSIIPTSNPQKLAAALARIALFADPWFSK